MGLYSMLSLSTKNDEHFQNQIFSVWKFPCLLEQPVRYRLECLYSVPTVLLPLIHVVLDFRWHAAGLSACMNACLALLSFCQYICYLKVKLLVSIRNKNTFGRAQGWSNNWRCCSTCDPYVLHWSMEFFSAVSLFIAQNIHIIFFLYTHWSLICEGVFLEWS